MIFNKCLVIGEVYIIAYFFIFFKNLKKKYFVEVNKTVCTELSINDQVVSRVKYFSTKEKQPETTKGYPIYELIPGIPITDKDHDTQSEEYEISSTHEDEHNDDMTETRDDEESIEEQKYEYEHPSDRENGPSNDIIKNQYQNDQEDATIENDSPEKLLNMRTWSNQNRQKQINMREIQKQETQKLRSVKTQTQGQEVTEQGKGLSASK